MVRVTVLGAGALGSLLGALLHERGHDVTLVGRPAHVEAVARDGLLLDGGAYGPPRRVRVAAATQAPAGADLVVLAVKTQDVARALDGAKDALGSAPVVGIQNGLAQDGILAAMVGPERAVGAVCALDASFLEPGNVTCRNPGVLVVGAVAPKGAAAEAEAARVLADAVEVRRTRDLAGARWTKLLVNLSNVVPALTDLSYQEAADHPGLARANVRMLREGVAVARAEGVRLQDIPWTPALLLHASARLPEALASRLYARRVHRVLGDAPAYGSTWQSRLRGASLETPWLNGEVVRRGRERGVATPVNARATALAEAGARLAPEDAARALLP